MPEPTIIKQTHTFDSKVIPGATFTLRRRTVKRKIELETKMTEYLAQVMQIHIDAEHADDEKHNGIANPNGSASSGAGGSSGSQRAKANGGNSGNGGTGGIVEINPVKPIDKSKSDTATETPSDTPVVVPFLRRPFRTWEDVAVQKEIERKVDMLSTTKVRPLYLEVYLSRVDNYQVEGEDGSIHDIHTSQDLCEYGLDDFLTEILDTMRTTREVGFALTATEIANLQLPSILPGQVDGQNGSTSARGAGNTLDISGGTAVSTTQS